MGRLERQVGDCDACPSTIRWNVSAPPLYRTICQPTMLNDPGVKPVTHMCESHHDDGPSEVGEDEPPLVEGEGGGDAGERAHAHDEEADEGHAADEDQGLACVVVHDHAHRVSHVRYVNQDPEDS